MDRSIEVYVLTHKEVKEPHDNTLYKPILNGSTNLNIDYGYIRDDTGDNISNQNKYYAEMTGEYWAWKNSKSDIVGFCHYRRWFIKNIKWEKLTKEDIIKDLKTYDIILPKKRLRTTNLWDFIKKDNKMNYGANYEDYLVLKDIIKNDFNEYYDTFKKVMDGNSCYLYNMFICDKKLANEYFNWVFQVLENLKTNIDFSKYPPDNKRVLGFISEQLLCVFVEKNNLKIKEYDLYFSERKVPLLSILNVRFPILTDIEVGIFKILKKIK